jgi:cytidine deaminase
MLEELAQELGAKVGDQGVKVFDDVAGKVVIRTELFPCQSCADVIREFSEMFPNIVIEIQATTRHSFKI